MPLPLNTPAGTYVIVTQDDGSKVCVRTRTSPWQTKSGAWVVSHEGRVGGYDVNRCELAEGPKVIRD